MVISAPRHAYGLKYDRHNSRDFRFSDLLPTLADTVNLRRLPGMADVTTHFSPVRDQLRLGGCTGFALATGLVECLMTQAGYFVETSPLALYYWERWLEHSVGEDAGAQLRDGLRVLRKTGAMSEVTWPYDPARFAERPPDVFPLRRIAQFHRVHTFMELKQALAANLPVAIGIEIFASFESDEVAKSGMIPIPEARTETWLGGHAVCVGRYDDDPELVKVKNSWGTDWGDKGYFYLPYEFFNPRRELVMDMWTATL